MDKKTFLETFSENLSPVLAERIKPADRRFYGQIARLCQNNNTCIADTLDHIAVLIAVVEGGVDTAEKGERRKRGQREYAQKQRALEKIRANLFSSPRPIKLTKISEIAETIEEEGIDRATASQSAAKYVCRDEAPFDFSSLLSAALPLNGKTCKPVKKPAATKKDRIFNELIFHIYQIARKTHGLTDNKIFEYIAKILTSLNIQNSRGNPYTTNAIYKIVRPQKRPST